MNTNHLKKFAQEARRKLIEQVGAKLEFVLTTDSAELREKTEQLKQLKQELGSTKKEQLIEKVSYTWFNRLMALRFMDANDYQPLGIRIITPKDGYTIPEILDEAKRGNIPDELKVNRQKIFDLLDNKAPSTNPQNETFKELLIAACNHLHTSFPFLFEKINDYTELLIPDDLTSDFSVVKDIRDGMPLEECQNVEIVGWLYQFYISEKKDEVFALKSRVEQENIPAATQLFTPRWIVEYMVQNTIGKLWLQNRPQSKLREYMPFYIETELIGTTEYLNVYSPEELKIVDPASGSGHILVYAFDLLTKIYEEEGYSTSEIPKLIIEKNLYGFEIDERASQLSALALMMKAFKYQRRAKRKNIHPNILCFRDLNFTHSEIKESISLLNLDISQEMQHDIKLMHSATNYGSLISPHSDKNEIIQLIEKLNDSVSETDVFQRNKISSLIDVTNTLLLLKEKFHCVVTNPPYMGIRNMNTELSQYVKTYYPDSKADLMACFMERGLTLLQRNGYMGMINQHSWMFLSSYEVLRRKLCDNSFIDTLLHLGARTFPEIGGEVVQNASFTIYNGVSNGNGTYIRLVDYDNSSKKKSKALEAINNIDCDWYFINNQLNYRKIPSNPIGYWVSNRAFEVFSNRKMHETTTLFQGIITGNNDKLIRYWYEVERRLFANDLKSIKEFNEDIYWVSYNKGGSSRKWYGNLDLVVNFKRKGKNYTRGRLQFSDHFFEECFSWNYISTSIPMARYYPEGTIWDVHGSSGFCTSHNDLIYKMALISSTVGQDILSVINPTVSFQVENIGAIPVIYPDNLHDFCQLIESSISTSKTEWDIRETSWNFLQNEIIRIRAEDIEESYDLYKRYWTKTLKRLHENEEKLNSLFIEVYGLEEELTPIVPLQEITLLQEELDNKTLIKLNKKLIRDSNSHLVNNYEEIELPFDASEIMAKFISYSVGCMLGRYSLDKEGLILANQGETLENYFHKIEKKKNECIFLPDNDNIIPMLDEDWFEDDIVGRFYQFLKVTFGTKNFNKNIAFIEEQLGKDIRKYFVKDFYPDHIKRYNKRPIYWLFSSPNGSFNALIYAHRYTSDTVSNILNKYVKEFIGKLNTRKEHLERVKESGSASDKSKAIKESDYIQKMLVELHEYERDILYPLATERIEINLDDGVLVNYNKFGKAVKEVSGLNDKKTKEKVRKFDWIDTSQIR